ncbi:hypothetical protein MNBD_UNCLBAC01-2135 [hydrothermal vent metagenome]|uniref:Uncharacterized protein n=1 Tax=hydrothermal vent metagenome TaxID=652676 RepID=A0A3B1CYT5_9ZZZZ
MKLVIKNIFSVNIIFVFGFIFTFNLGVVSADSEKIESIKKLADRIAKNIDAFEIDSDPMLEYEAVDENLGYVTKTTNSYEENISETLDDNEIDISLSVETDHETDTVLSIEADNAVGESVFVEADNEIDTSLFTEERMTGKWSQEIREQKIEDITGGLSISESYLDAKSITLPKNVEKKEKKEEEVKPILTDEQIIRSLIKPQYKDKKIDLNFDEVQLSDIFMTLGASADINVFVDPAFRNLELDIHLKQVSLEEAFMLMANAYDLGFKRVADSLYVSSIDKIKSQNMVAKVIKLRNIRAQDAEELIEDLIGTVNLNEELNSLIVMGDPSEVVEVQRVIALLDQAQPQVLLEAKIIEMNKDALKDLGIDWSDQIISNYQESGRPVGKGTGVEDAARSVLEITKFQRSALQFSSAIKMLESQNKARVLSNPRIATINDKEAEIFIGDEIPYTITNVTGGVATTDVRFVKPGIRLKITPSIIEKDFVVIKVEPEVSFIFAFRGPNDEFPHVKTREATAYVRVRNQQPFILGGLLNQEDKENLFKVPMIGDIPLLGNLFSYEKRTVVDTELIITITPTIVSED